MPAWNPSAEQASARGLDPRRHARLIQQSGNSVQQRAAFRNYDRMSNEVRSTKVDPLRRSGGRASSNSLPGRYASFADSIVGSRIR